MKLLLGLSLLVLHILSGAWCAKILILPVPFKSHVRGLATAGEELVKDGHEVTILMPPQYNKMISKKPIKTINYPDDLLNKLQADRKPVHLMLAKGETFNAAALTLQLFPKFFGDVCELVLSDKQIMDTIKTTKFDLGISEYNPMFGCINTILYKFDIPFYIYSYQALSWSAGLPAMPSVEPLSAIPLTPDMNFFDRIKNLAATLVPHLLVGDNHLIKKYVPEKPTITYDVLARKAMMWMNNIEQHCLDYPRISAPHFQFVGSSTAKPPKPLPDDLAKFMDDASQGVVILSFGSSEFRPSLQYNIQKFLDAFKKISYKVLIAFDCSELKVSPNVRCITWMPQNDLLAHPNTLVFINHGGTNGQMEAIGHGVPMITVGVMAEQQYNALRGKYHGYGLQLYIHEFTPNDLVDAINEIATNSSYRENTKRCAEIISDFPPANELIVFWTNHLLRFGGSHLRHPGLDMPLYKLFMLDVLFVLGIVMMTISVLVFCSCRFLYRRITKQKTKKD